MARPGSVVWRAGFWVWRGKGREEGAHSPGEVGSTASTTPSGQTLCVGTADGHPGRWLSSAREPWLAAGGVPRDRVGHTCAWRLRASEHVTATSKSESQRANWGRPPGSRASSLRQQRRRLPPVGRARGHRGARAPQRSLRGDLGRLLESKEASVEGPAPGFPGGPFAMADRPAHRSRTEGPQNGKTGQRLPKGGHRSRLL